MRKESHELPALEATLHFLVGSGIPLEHKVLLTDLVERAIAQASEHSGLAEGASLENQWRPEELQKVEAFLKDKIAFNWQHADELLLHLARDLGRTPKDVKRKATELGLGVGVDYRQAKARGGPDDR